MKILTLQINKECFHDILNAKQDIEHRYIYPSNVTRYVYFKHDGKEYKRQEDIPDDDKDIEVIPIKYDDLYIINGRRKDAPRLMVEVKMPNMLSLQMKMAMMKLLKKMGKNTLSVRYGIILVKYLAPKIFN